MELPHVHITQHIRTNDPPYYHRCWLLNCALITSQIIIRPFRVEDTVSMISNKSLKF